MKKDSGYKPVNWDARLTSQQIEILHNMFLTAGYVVTISDDKLRNVYTNTKHRHIFPLNRKNLVFQHIIDARRHLYVFDKVSPILFNEKMKLLEAMGEYYWIK